MEETQIENTHCYCGKERNLNIIELLCADCSNWFHESCIGYQIGRFMPFTTYYCFVCKNCSKSGLETFRKHQATISQMCVTAIANLQQAAVRDGTHKRMFSKDSEIIPYIEQYWDSMTTMPRRITQSWYSTVHRALMKDVNTFFLYEEHEENGPMFGLIEQDLKQIMPNYEVISKSAPRLTEDAQFSQKNQKNKRKFFGAEPAPGKKGRPSGSDVAANVRLPAHGYPLDHPFNKDGYRYILAEPDPHAPFRQEFDESPDWAGRPIPGWLYRTVVPSSCLLALHDRAPQLKVSEDRLTVTGDKGFCMLRATNSVNRGCWYYEVTIKDKPENSNTRLGWGQAYANLQAPVGYDKFGYSWRSRKGTVFHESKGIHYSEPFGVGEVLGCLISLPEEETVDYLPDTYKDRPLVKFKTHLYFEDKDRVQETLKTLRPLPGSKIEFFRNGKSHGIAYKDINAGSYYPSISLFKNITLSVNFGPNFKHGHILTERNAKGMCERAEDLINEQSLSDLLYLTEHEGRLRLDNPNV